MSIDELRAQIDALDRQLVSALTRRAELACDIGKLKGPDGPTYSPEREAQVLKHVSELADGALSAEAIRTVYREVISVCRALEVPITVAYPGPPGSFTHEAAVSRFGSSVRYTATRDIASVFTELAQRRADYGVVPVETSMAGGVSDTLDMFPDYDETLCGEIVLDIHLNLLARSAEEDITTIYSKPEALSQCRGWLATNCPHADQVDVATTSKAAEMVAQAPGAAAVASRLSAELYGLSVVAANIEDHARNRTRFLVLGHDPVGPTGADKTTVMVTIKDEVGALFRLLRPIEKYEINLSWIESRPSKREAWDYVFFLDMAGHAGDEPLSRLIDELRQHASYLRVLGSFPAAAEARKKNS
jgi:chorismate mutase/prephenate dehydratase